MYFTFDYSHVSTHLGNTVSLVLIIDTVIVMLLIDSFWS